MPSFSGAALQPRELRIVAVEHDRAAGLQPDENFRLGVGNRLDAGEELQMHRLHRGDDGDLRAYHLDQGLDFAGVIHADLEDRKLDL